MSGRTRLREIREFVRPRTRWRAFRAGQLPSPVAPELPAWPADFRRWLQRSGGRAAGAYPEAWRTIPTLPIEHPARVAVVLHAYYPELVDELVEQLQAIPVRFDLFVTDATPDGLEIDAALPNLVHVHVLRVDNHGRDVLPLINVVNAGYLDPYEVILKVHTKRSEWRDSHELAGGGADWRASLLAGLLGDDGNVAAILGAFAEQPNLGIVTADGSVLGPEQWGDNEDNVANLLRRIELTLDESKLRFAAGSMYWIRGFVLQGLRSLNLGADDFEEEVGQVNATTAHAVERLLGVVSLEAGLVVQERSQVRSPRADSWTRYSGEPIRPRARIIPFYLPQFHPVPENDRWWGKGFTEWINVTAARPVYTGQHQPRLPLDLGFYDLRLDDVRADQLDLSRAHGIAGFMYYHYWFAGQPLLERPIQRLVDSDLAQPFCVMWANENWTRRWDGRQADVLMAQDYDRVPAEEFIDSIVPLLRDERYLCIDGRKIVAVYRPGQLPDLEDTISAWRKRAREAGAGELFVLRVDVDVEYDGLDEDHSIDGVDGALGFPPHNHLYRWLPHEGLGIDRRFTGNLLSYDALVRDAETRLRSAPPANLYPGVMVTFDNTPRRQWDADIWYGSNPYTFRRWLATAVSAVMGRPRDERIVFVNAWNEWAEGAVLEPSDRFGRTFLLAVRDVAHS